MGLIRKTLSVGTLGIVSFRSKKEKLQRAERGQHEAEAVAQRERTARIEVEKKGRRAARSDRTERLAALVAAAEPFVRQGLDAALAAGTDAGERGRKSGRRATRKTKKQAQRSLRQAKGGASDRLAALIAAAEPHVREGLEAARSAGSDAGDRGRKMGRRAAKKSKKQAKRSLGQAQAALSDARETLAPQAADLVARAHEAVGKVTSS